MPWNSLWTFSVLVAPGRALVDHWVACLLLIAMCLIHSFYKRIASWDNREKNTSQITSTQPTSLFHNRLRPAVNQIVSPSCPSTKHMRYHKHPRRVKTKKSAVTPELVVPCIEKTIQPYELFLVLDLEGTCQLGTDFNYPNEIIEFPVSILQWKDRGEDGRADTLEVLNEFRSFVKPTWRPTLSAFCTQLTGITQDQVDAAPPFSEVLANLGAFLAKNGLIEEGTGKRLRRFCWCSDGPWDIRDFFVKQCFISKVEMPTWIQGDVLDVRLTVQQWAISQSTGVTPNFLPQKTVHGLRRPSPNISAQLKILDLPAFEGRQHSGIDDTRNIAKIVTELARRGVRLSPNTMIYPGRRWRWMGKHGQILEDCIT